MFLDSCCKVMNFPRHSKYQYTYNSSLFSPTSIACFSISCIPSSTCFFVKHRIDGAKLELGCFKFCNKREKNAKNNDFLTFPSVIKIGNYIGFDPNN